jgi:selenocysteine-specific elongation factor
VPDGVALDLRGELLVEHGGDGSGRASGAARAIDALAPDALAKVRRRVVGLAESEGNAVVARLRDELGTSRKYAQALLDHCDAMRLTLRLPDDARVLRRRSGTGQAAR